MRVAFYSPKHTQRENNRNNRNNRSEKIETRNGRKKISWAQKKGKWKIKYPADEIISRNSLEKIYVGKETLENNNSLIFIKKKPVNEMGKPTV